MAAIKGIFEPFYKYVQRQLNIRRVILSNISEIEGELLSANPNTNVTSNEFMDLENSTFEDAKKEGKIKQNKGGLPYFNSDKFNRMDIESIRYFNTIDDPTSPFHGQINYNSPLTKEQLKEADLENIYDIDPDTFYKFTTERQCSIRMASGVDIQKNNNLLYKNETSGIESWKNGQQTARDWVLVGNMDPYYAEDLRNDYLMPPDNSRYTEKFTTSKYNHEVINVDWNDALNTSKGGFEPIGSKSENIGGLRNEARDGFGFVPNPGIIDATISTKSEDGSLREATVNFICHNRGQLEVLEALYMRPGYPILLDWGWTPYIDNDFHIQPNNQFLASSAIDAFFSPTSTLEQINETIRKNKELSGGNYDGFVGYCKNFSFKVREDGGYDCTTELIAQAEMLASLKAKTKVVPRILKFEDLTKALKIVRNKDGSISGSTYYSPDMDMEVVEVDEFLYLLTSIKATLDKTGDEIYASSLGTTRETEILPSYIKSWYDWDWLTNIVFMFDPPEGYKMTDEKGNDINITELNIVNEVYQHGFNEVLDLVADVKKVTRNEVDATFSGSYGLPDFLYDQQKDYSKQNQNNVYYERFVGYGDPTSVQNNQRVRNWHLGLDSFCFGTIMKEMVLTASPTEENSGIQSRIFLRWDLICQIFNLKVTPQYKKNTPISELTYLHNNQQAYNTTKTIRPHKEESDYEWTDSAVSYIEYSLPSQNPIYPGDMAYGSVPVGGSFDANICIMPHEIGEFRELTLNWEDDPNKIPKASWEDDTTTKEKTGADLITPSAAGNETYANFGFESFSFISGRDFDFNSTNNAIGRVLFNLDYLIQTYESLALETYQTNENGEEKTKRRLKKEINIHDWITTIWNGVNEACGGYYDFGLHSEHERGHVARIVDFTFNKNSNGYDRPVFQFYPQGLSSTVRDFTIESKLDEDFASAISISAQAPKDIHSLESLSFKAFHTDIKNRFTEEGMTVAEREEMIKEAKEDYDRLKNDYIHVLKSLKFYKTKMFESNYESFLVTKLEGGVKMLTPASPEAAKDLARGLETKRVELASRYPEFTDDTQTQRYDGTAASKYHYTGEYRKDSTHYRNAVIPLTTSLTLDGISGILPLNVFKINHNFLPIGYNNPNIAFVVKQESQKITSGQDWTTSLTGYLTLLNDNPVEGSNTDVEEYISPTLYTYENPDLNDTNKQFPSTLNPSPPCEACRKNDDGTYRNHNGWDLTGNIGGENPNIVANIEGTVTAINASCVDTSYTTCGGGYGNYIEIKHNTSPYDYSFYAHLDTVLVAEDAPTSPGTILGTQGTTGRSSGDHLHFEIRMTPPTGYTVQSEHSIPINKVAKGDGGEGWPSITTVSTLDKYFYFTKP
jgi:murein DD-endopeptidase MepM/ murein hydrolase activator NlpD